MRKDAKSVQLVPAHFISSVIVTFNGKTILDGHVGVVSRKAPISPSRSMSCGLILKCFICHVAALLLDPGCVCQFFRSERILGVDLMLQDPNIRLRGIVARA